MRLRPWSVVRDWASEDQLGLKLQATGHEPRTLVC